MWTVVRCAEYHGEHVQRFPKVKVPWSRTDSLHLAVKRAVVSWHHSRVHIAEQGITRQPTLEGASERFLEALSESSGAQRLGFHGLKQFSQRVPIRQHVITQPPEPTQCLLCELHRTLRLSTSNGNNQLGTQRLE